MTQQVLLDDGLVRTDGPNGLVVLSEQLAGVRSVALGIYVRTASAHETPARMGISHCLEHMVFKGTARYSAKELALALESRGGSLDAFTGRDQTSYQAHILDEDLPLAADVLTELVHRPLLRADDLALERNVILEEIAGMEDTPDDLVFELHSETLWGAHPYGYSILGTHDTVTAIEARELAELHQRSYRRGSMVIAAAGNVDHDALCAELEARGWFAAEAPGEPAPTVAPAAAVRGAERREVNDTNQVHLVFGTDAFASTDPRRYALSILVNTLGGGMSSRLFQRVREELGLCYAVYAYKQLMQAAGQVGIYVATGPETADAAADAIRAECTLLAREGLTADELVAGRRQLKGQLMLALESTGARMSRLASTALTGEPYRRLDDVLARIDAVSSDDVAALAAEFFDPVRFSTVRLGPA